MTDNIHRLPDRKTALPMLSTGELDLWSLPERLDDTALAAVEAVAKEPLPSLPSCAETHLAKCLRIMLAVLPKQNTDELGGELFVEAYKRQIGHYPNEAISYLADRATACCRWFPTIAECLEILSVWKRSDEATRRQTQARFLLSRERNLRWIGDCEPIELAPPITQAEVDRMTPEMIKIGLGCGALERDHDGNIRPASDHP